MALNEDPQKRNVQQLISLITTDGILEEASAQNEEVRKRLHQVLKPILKGGDNVPAEESPVGGYALGQQARHNRGRGWNI